MKIKVVTFNLRMNTHRDGINYFFNRAPLILARIREEKPDVIGFQEATQPILEWLKATLTEYTLVGIGRSKDFKSEANPIAFRKDRFELFSFNQFWLSPTPEVPGTRYEEQSDCPRVCCAAKLREIGTTEVIRFYNTHLDHIGEKARLYGMNQIVAYMEEEKAKSAHPVILTGDMNAEPYELSIKAICSSVTLDKTSSICSDLPATKPATSAASMPLIPPEWGTTTLFAFFIMLPLTLILADSGKAPRTSLAFAAAYAIAIGSVHPIAGTSSSPRSSVILS